MGFASRGDQLLPDRAEQGEAVAAEGRGGAIGTAWALRALRAVGSLRLRSSSNSLSASAAAMAPVVSMAPREAAAPGEARGPRRPGLCPARAGRRTAAAGRGWAGRRPERASAAAGPRTLRAEEAAARGRGGDPSSRRPRLGLGPLPGAGEELERRGCSPWSPAGVEQPGSGPGYLGGGRGMRRGPATFGSRASGQPAVRTRGRVGVSTESGLAGLFSERGLVLRTPVACPEEVSSSGRSCTDPFWCRAKARFHSLLAWLGLGRVAPSCHSACRLLSSWVTWRKFSCPLLGHPCEHFRFTFLPGWAFNACMHLYAFGLKPHGSYQAYCGQVFYVLIEYSRGLDLKAVLLIVTRKRSVKRKKNSDVCSSKRLKS